MMFMFGTKPSNGPADLLLVGIFLTGLCYFVSLATMFSWVRITPGHLIVQNPGKRFKIPWARVQSLDAASGLNVKVRGVREPVPSVAYQGSLIGSIAGSPSSRKAAGAIARFVDESADSQAAGEIEQSFPWRSHVGWVAIGWTTLGVVLPTVGRLTT
ncbi:hypothetical protein V6U77_08230 [Micromonospora sp. CPCC 205546]